MYTANVLYVGLVQQSSLYQITPKFLLMDGHMKLIRAPISTSKSVVQAITIIYISKCVQCLLYGELITEIPRCYAMGFPIIFRIAIHIKFRLCIQTFYSGLFWTQWVFKNLIMNSPILGFWPHTGVRYNIKFTVVVNTYSLKCIWLHSAIGFSLGYQSYCYLAACGTQAEQ